MKGYNKGMNKDQELEYFTHGYIACSLDDLLADSGEEDDRMVGDFESGDFGIGTREKMEEDCRKFFDANYGLLKSLVGTRLSSHGHDFWLTRNGHGAGFGDRGYGEAGDKLSEAADAFGVCDLYAGDDGLLYIVGAEVVG